MKKLKQNKTNKTERTKQTADVLGNEVAKALKRVAHKQNPELPAMTVTKSNKTKQQNSSSAMADRHRDRDRHRSWPRLERLAPGLVSPSALPSDEPE